MTEGATAFNGSVWYVLAMSSDRLTVSLDAEAREALDAVSRRSDSSQSELVRRALAFYAANYEAASTDHSVDLEEYYKMLTGGEHVLLDVDFLHCFLDHVTEDGEPTEAFLDDVDRVSDYHAAEFAERFDSLDGFVEWLSLCGFLTVRRSTADTYHVVFPSENVRWFMTRFIERCVDRMDFDVTVKPGVAKALLVEES